MFVSNSSTQWTG